MGQQEIHEHEALGGGSGRRLRCRLTSLSRSLQTILRINLDGTWGFPCGGEWKCQDCYFQPAHRKSVKGRGYAVAYPFPCLIGRYFSVFPAHFLTAAFFAAQDSSAFGSEQEHFPPPNPMAKEQKSFRKTLFLSACRFCIAHLRKNPLDHGGLTCSLEAVENKCPAARRFFFSVQ